MAELAVPGVIDPTRVAEILVDLAGGGQRRGSGYRVTTGSVLTAAHVVVGAARVRVRFNADRPDEWVSPARSVILATAGDVAVLAIDPDGLPAVEPTGFGRLGDRDAVLECRSLGFPRFKLRSDHQRQDGLEQYRDTAHIVGSLAVLSNRREGTLEISIATPPAADRDAQRSPWEGMSGAVVFARGRIIGVISEHHPSDGLSRLAAARVDSWYDALDPEDLHVLATAIGLPGNRQTLPDMVPTAAPAIEAAYTAQLRDIAPTQLLHRERELQELVNWCAEPGGYLWWQAPPWAGKTALMASFALHPPAGTVVASFFITSRLAGQADSDVFLQAMIDQLSALAEMSATPAPGQAARRGQFLHLLDAADGLVTGRGQRLILVVDGLDEDRSSHGSIASLLPRHPPGCVHVLVASRPHPGIPADVPGDHLLRSCEIRNLSPSSFGRDMQIEAISELKDHLKAGAPNAEILGLITASGGGLTRQDLHELSGRPAWELEDQLGSAFGRSLRTRLQDERDHAYLFAHETLRVIAETTLWDELGRYRDRIHAWAETYSSRDWPADTPGYLLRPYGRMLIEQGDMWRMGILATNRTRHELMAHRSGTDVDGLSEIAATWQKLDSLADPNLRVRTLLALERSRLENRNTVISVQLPEALALAGEVDRAEALAQLISNPYKQSQAFIGLVRAVASADLARAERMADSIADPMRRVEALAAGITALAARDLRDGAELIERLVKTAGENTDPVRQARALIRIVEAVAIADPGTAIRLAEEALPIARAAVDSRLRIKLLTAMARALSGTDSVLAQRLADESLGIATEITNSHDRWEALAAVAEVVAPADPDRAVQLVNADSDTTRSSESLAAVVRAMASADPHGAVQLARTINNQRWQVFALAEIARCNPGTSRGLLTEAVEMARRIAGPFYRAQALTAVAAAMAEMEPHQARPVAEQAAQAARAIESAPARADALTSVSMAVTKADREYSLQLAVEADRRADAIVDAQRRIQAFTAVVAMVTGVDPSRAVTLAKTALDSTAADVAEVRALVAASLAASSSLPKALEAARNINNSGLRNQAAIIIALVMARTDPDGALRILTRPGTAVPVTRTGSILQEVALSIVENDPDKALSVALTMKEAERVPLMEAVARSLAASDPDRAENLVMTTSSTPSDQAVLLARMAQAAAPAHPEHAARFSAKAAELARKSDQQGCYMQVSAILLGITACTDPDRAERMIGQIAQPGYRNMPQAEVARMLSHSDPERAIRLAMGIEDLESRSKILAEIASQANRLGASGRAAAARALTLLLSGDQWPDAFGPLAAIDPDAAQAGCGALIAEPAFNPSGDSPRLNLYGFR